MALLSADAAPELEPLVGRRRALPPRDAPAVLRLSSSRAASSRPSSRCTEDPCDRVVRPGSTRASTSTRPRTTACWAIPLGVEPRRARDGTGGSGAVAWYAEHGRGRGSTRARRLGDAAVDGSVVARRRRVRARSACARCSRRRRARTVPCSSPRRAGPELEAEAAALLAGRAARRVLLPRDVRIGGRRAPRDGGRGPPLRVGRGARRWRVLPHDSPGYAGWDVGEQATLLSLRVDGPRASSGRARSRRSTPGRCGPRSRCWPSSALAPRSDARSRPRRPRAVPQLPGGRRASSGGRRIAWRSSSCRPPRRP